MVVPRCVLQWDMDKRITRYRNLDDMKADEYRAWTRVSGSERLRAVMELSTATYQLQGRISDVPRLQRTLVRIQRSRS